MKILNYAKGSKYKNGVIKPTYENKKYDVLLISLLRRYYCCKMKLNKTKTKTDTLSLAAKDKTEK